MTKRTKEQTAELDTRLQAGIYANRTMSQLARQLGASASYLYIRARIYLGFSQMLVDPAERHAIEERRKKLLAPTKGVQRASTKGARE